MTVNPCTVPVGPQVPCSRNPLEMFSHFFDDEILSLIVRETNLFAEQSLAATHSNTTWETNTTEIKAYLGFMILMGINRLPEIRDYWARDEKLHNSFIASRITDSRRYHGTSILWITPLFHQGMSQGTTGCRRFSL